MKTKKKDVIKCVLCNGTGSYKKEEKIIRCSFCKGKGTIRQRSKTELIQKLRNVGCTYRQIQKLMKFNSKGSVHYYLTRTLKRQTME